jgi:pilus assembly protein FimV
MKMKKHVLAGLAVAGSLGFLTPLTSYAFGLGKIEVKSALNEPFRAEIPVTALRSGEKDNLEVKLASPTEFEKAGLFRSFILSDVNFEIVDKEGQSKILLTTKKAVKEPFLDFLITATTGSGQMLREYTVLLDPPAYVTAPVTESTSAVAPSPKVQSQSTSTEYQYQSSNTSDSYQVKRDDTLWNVALDTRPSDAVSVHQMMMALYEENPTAFSNSNVNGLKAGATLTIPAMSDIQSLSQAQALAAFRAQNEAWKKRKTKTAAVTTDEPTSTAVTTVESTEVDSQPEAMSPDTSTATEMATAGVVDTESRLNLVAPDEGNSLDDASPNVQGNDELSQLSEQLTLAQETIEAQAQENVDLKSRLDLMEEQLETLRRLISVNDPELAQLQDVLAKDQATAETAASVATTIIENEGSELESSEPMSTETAEVQTEPKSSVESAIAQAAETLNVDEETMTTLIDDAKAFIAENKLPVVGGLAVLLLLLLLLVRRSKRERTWDEAVEEIEDDNKAEALPTVGVAVVEETEETPEEYVEEKSVAELVEQADMFIGYADYVQAKHALDQARQIDPEDTMVAHKLLFIYFKQEQVSDFVDLAEEVDFDKDSIEWAEVAKWGQTLAPTNALFKEVPVQSQEDVDNTPTETPETTIESNPESSIEPVVPEQATEQAVEPEAPEEDSHIEFDLNAFTTPTESTEETATPVSEAVESTNEGDDDLLSFSVDNGLNEEVESSALEPEVLDLDADLNDDSLSETVSESVDDLDISIDIDSVEDETDELVLNDEDVADLTIDLDVDDTADMDFDIADIDDIDEAETKLDLASAYIEMGDPEGARSILNEVLVEGDDTQKKRAEELLSSLS